MLARPARGHCPTNHPFVGALEERTKRFVTIEHLNNASNIAKCHKQWQSILFCLPPEIREIIYDYASRPNVDPGDLTAGPQCLAYLRMPVVWRRDLAWLGSCRRVWLEANSYAWLTAEPTFYRHSAHPDLYGFLYQLTAVNVHNLKRLHIGQECHNLRMNDSIMRLLENTKLQVWPPHLTITLVAYPSLWEEEAIKTWFNSILNHRKLGVVQDVEVLFHVPESQSEAIALTLEELQSDTTLSDWHVNLEDPKGKRWIRVWGDVMLQNHWANKVDIPYRTFKTFCRRKGSQTRPETYDRDSAWDCWHLVPYRVVFGQRDSMEPDFGCADRLAEQYRVKWEEQNSLLKFAE